MSIIAVQKIAENAVPRWSSSVLTPVEEYKVKDQREFFCSQGHDFIIYFGPDYEGIIWPIFECPVCETIAVDHPL